MRQNKRTVDPYEGISDPVELLRVFHTPRKYDPLIEWAPLSRSAEELYRELSQDGARRLMLIASEALRGGDRDLGEEIAVWLATRTPYSLDEMLEAWVDQDHFWPSVVFREAGTRIRDRTIEALESGTESFRHALSALAWIGDEAVQERFRAWTEHPPPWSSKLKVPVTEYTKDAGWEIKASSQSSRRELYFKQCFRIAQAQEVTDKAVTIGLTTEQCPWCQGSLSLLLNIDLSDLRFAFLGFDGPSLPVLTCTACTCYGVFFASIDSSGKASLLPELSRPSKLPDTTEEWDDLPWRDIPIVLTPRRSIAAAYWCHAPSATQVGGFPTWIQNPYFPNCPRCSESMRFMAQLDMADFPSSEGIYSAFLCSPCRITATCFQQS